jgi:hypothetical protein
MDYDLLLYIHFLTQSGVSNWQVNCSTKARPGGVPSKKGLAVGSRGCKLIRLLNIDYILLARIIANRRRLTLATAIHSDQCCGVPCRKSLDAMEGIPDVIT